MQKASYYKTARLLTVQMILPGKKQMGGSSTDFSHKTVHLTRRAHQEDFEDGNLKQCRHLFHLHLTNPRNCSEYEFASDSFQIWMQPGNSKTSFTMENFILKAGHFSAVPSPVGQMPTQTYSNTQLHTQINLIYL